MTSWVANWASGAWANNGLRFHAGGNTGAFYTFSADEMSVYGQDSYIAVQWNTLPPVSNPQSPGEGATVMTETPVLTSAPVADADGQGVSYWFRVASGPDGESGQVLNSGWIGSSSWTIPTGSLVDGQTYTWRVFTSDGEEMSVSAARSLRVNLRLGADGPSPRDEVGPVGVNLATGNVTTSLSSPKFETVGGPIGVSYEYNSKAQSSYGLTGEYFNNTCLCGVPTLTRRDQTVNFAWGDSPGAAVNADQFSARWTGYITVPYRENTYNIGVRSDDGVRVWVGEQPQLVVDRWFDQGMPASPQYGSPIDFRGSQTLPITIEFYENGGAAGMELWIKGSGTNLEPEQQFGDLPVPAAWLSPRSPGTPALPKGWNLSVDTDGGLSYTDAVIGSDSVILRSGDWEITEFRKTSASSWRPLDGDDSVLTVSGGEFVVHGADGVIYTFDGKGKLVRAVAAPDVANPAAPVYSWSPSTNRLERITDPVSGRYLQLTYAVVNTGGSSTECVDPPGGAGFDPRPPAGMLCKLTHPDGTTTKLFYRSRQLARVEDPGGVVTDFAYDGAQRLTKVRSPLAADMIGAGQRADDGNARTEIAYDGANRVSSVTEPAPTSGAARPAHSYGYVTGSRTEVHVAGLPEPRGYARRADFDSAGRATADTDTAGLTTSMAWDGSDRPTTSSDPAGLTSTSVYDRAGRVTDTYGPSPTAWFQGQTPKPEFAAQTPRSQVFYDEGIRGLAATYWNNTSMSGAPAAQRLGAGDPSGAMNADWGYGSPAPGVNADYFSAYFTGEINLPNAGTYTFYFNADDNVRLYIDDQAMQADWTPCCGFTQSVTLFNAAAGWHRIRIDYREYTAPAYLQLHWSGPGVTQGIVPGANLSPRYGLTTRAISPDGDTATTEYAAPNLRLATATVTDPAGLALRATTSYETEGAGYLRPTARTLPKGAATQVGYAYYANGDTRAHPCNGGTAVNQGGLLRTSTAADPEGADPAIVREYRYDTLGRRVGSLVQGDSGWSCTTYDSRGRVASQRDRLGGITTYDYSTPGVIVATFPDSAGATRTTRNEVDLLARTVKYTDELGTQFRTTYDQPGRTLNAYRGFAGQGETLLTVNAYDNDGRLASQTEYASGTGRTTTMSYDAAGRPQTTSLPNGTTSTSGYDPNRGALASITHAKGAATLAAWSSTRRLDGKLAAETVDGRSRTYVYDRASRLTQVADGAATRRYAYDANTNRCATAATCAAPTYTYDSADRITSSPWASAYTYDAHGNVKTATLRDPQPADTLDERYDFNGGSRTWPISVGRNGTVNANADWTTTGQAPPVNASGGPTGNLAASGTATHNVPVDGKSRVESTLSWSKGNRAVSNSTSQTVNGGSTTTRAITPDAAGNISATLDWATTSTSQTWNSTVGAAANNEHTLVASADGTISASLSWPSGLPNPNLDLELVDNNGTVVASSAQLTGNSESISYNAAGLSTYPSSRTYKLRVKALATGSSYTLNGTWPVTATVDVKLKNSSGTVVANSTLVSGLRRRTLSYPNAAPGTYTFEISSTDFGASTTLAETHQVQAWADLTFNLKNPSGTVIATTRNDTGTATLGHTTTTGGTYSLQVVNNSGDLAVPTYGAPWTTTTLGDDVANGALAAAGAVGWGPNLFVGTKSTFDGPNDGWGSTCGWGGAGPGRNNSASAFSADCNSGPASATAYSAANNKSSNDNTGRTPATAGKAYLGSAYTRAYPDGPTVRPLLWFFNSSGSLLAETAGEASTDAYPDWNLRTVEATAPAGTAYLQLAFEWSSPPTGTYKGFKVDDASVQEGTPLGTNTATRSVTADGSGYFQSTLSWSKGNRAVSNSTSQTVNGGSTTTRAITPDAAGNISATLDWATTSTSQTWNSTVGAAANNEHTLVASADGTISASLSWPSGLPNPNLDLELVDNNGTVVASSAQLTGNSESISYNAAGLSTYPSSRTYKLRVKALATGSSYTLNGTWPVTATVDVKLKNSSGTVVANSTLVSGLRRRTLSYPNAAPGTYTFEISSTDFGASTTLAETHQVQAWADLTFNLKNPSGTVIATTRNATGTANLTTNLATAGSHTVEIVNNSVDLSVPAYTLNTTLPEAHAPGVRLELRDPQGNLVATDNGAKPAVLSSAATPGRYKLTAVASGAGNTTIGASFPGRGTTMSIDYDANDHATVTRDGLEVTTETVSPSGRVLRRRVTEAVGGAVKEDTLYGYAGASDSPAYTKPFAGGAVTSYFGGGTLSVIDVGGTPTYQHADGRGNILGTTDSAGAYIALPLADEFGRTEQNDQRLGWTGAYERFQTGGGLRLVRMGVRLYDPALGRFLQTDPIEGGSANDYDYAEGDPVNNFDLTGEYCVTGKNKNGSCRSIARGTRNLVNRPSSTVGRAIAAANGAKCAKANRGMIVCTEARGGYGRGGTTYGSVYVTGAKSVSPSLLRHESKHADQYAWFGGGAAFPVGYAIQEAFSGGGNCNGFEQNAGLKDGGYSTDTRHC